MGSTDGGFVPFKESKKQHIYWEMYVIFPCLLIRNFSVFVEQ